MNHLNEAKLHLSNATDRAQAAALIVLAATMRELVAEQRETNRILISMIRIDHGARAAGTVLDNFTQHPRPACEDDAE